MRVLGPPVPPGTLLVTNKLTKATWRKTSMVLVMEDHVERFCAWWACEKTQTSGVLLLRKDRCFHKRSGMVKICSDPEEWL